MLASGGFQARHRLAGPSLGPSARNFLIRGTPYNRGVVLNDMLDQGAESVGDPTQCHAVAIDGRAPKFDGGIVTRLDCVPFSVVVNRDGERFYDEGEDVWPKRYAIWGRLVAAQPDQVAYSIIDSQLDRPVHAVGLSRPRAPTRSRGWRRSWVFRRRSWRETVRRSTPPAGDGDVPAAGTGRAGDRGPRAAQDQLGAADHRAAVLRLRRCAPA